jgi:hypothetical protein
MSWISEWSSSFTNQFSRLLLSVRRLLKSRIRTRLRRDWPVDFAEVEPVVRGICHPYHVRSNGALKPEAYEPTPGTDEVSVMRVSWIGENQCKRYAKGLEEPDKGKVYRGLAVLTSAEVHWAGATVQDSRHIYSDHADIKLGIARIKGEPLPPEQLAVLRMRTRQLAKTARYFSDPAPASQYWHGPSLA